MLVNLFLRKKILSSGKYCICYLILCKHNYLFITFAPNTFHVYKLVEKQEQNCFSIFNSNTTSIYL